MDSKIRQGWTLPDEEADQHIKTLIDRISRQVISDIDGLYRKPSGSISGFDIIEDSCVPDNMLTDQDKLNPKIV